MTFETSNPGFMRWLTAAVIMAGFASPPLGARADEWCSQNGPGEPCRTASGSYHVRGPAAGERPRRAGALVVLHDIGGSGLEILQDPRIVEEVVGRGVVLVAPDALRRRVFDGPRVQRRVSAWYVSRTNLVAREVRRPHRAGAEDPPHEIQRIGRDEVDFLRGVIASAVQRFRLDRERIVVAGLGHGGAMVWDLACTAPRLARLFVAVGGAFYGEAPTTCRSGADLVHLHAADSGTWPPAGESRAIGWNFRIPRFSRLDGFDVERGARVPKLPVRESLDALARTNGCDEPDEEVAKGGQRIEWTRCIVGSLRYRLFDDGAELRSVWPSLALELASLGLRDPSDDEIPAARPVFKQAGDGDGVGEGGSAESRDPRGLEDLQPPGDDDSGPRFKPAPSTK